MAVTNANPWPKRFSLSAQLRSNVDPDAPESKRARQSASALATWLAGQHVLVKCGKCGRRLDELTWNSGVQSRTIVSRVSKTSVSVDSHDPYRIDAFVGAETLTFRCHRRCGARYTRNVDKLSGQFIRCAEAGSALILD